MKKNILILLAGTIAYILPVQSLAGEVLLLDSVIIQNTIDKQAEKITFDYNETGLLFLQTHYQKDNKQVNWSPTKKSQKEYNHQYNETSTISYSFDKEKNDWNEIMKSETQYSAGIQTIVYLCEPEKWEPVLKSENTNDQLLTIYSKKNNQWILSDQYETFFNESGYETASVSSMWDETTETWMQNTYSEAAFNASGQWIVSVLYCNNKNQQAIYIQYDEKNRLSLETGYQWNDETKDWIETHKMNFHYDAENRLSETIESRWNQSINRWMENKKTEYQYTNSEIIPTTVILYDRSNAWIPTTEYSFFYSRYWVNIEPVQPRMQVCIYPNPVKDWFQVSGLTGNAILNVLNINGQRLIYQNIQENETVSAQSLPEGVYIVTIQTNENTISQKIIKK